MKLVIDRFEGDIAVCEDENRNMMNIERRHLPEDTAEGDVINVKDSETIKESETTKDVEITIDKEETARRKAEIAELTKNMWEK